MARGFVASFLLIRDINLDIFEKTGILSQVQFVVNG
jgi:hypothetical protein